MFFNKNNKNVKHLETEEEYQQVLELRKKAYLDRPNVSEETANSDADISLFADEQDKNCTIYLYMENEKIIGSLRLVFGKENPKLQLFSYFDKLPPFLTNTDEIVEFSRTCIEPDYSQKMKILIALFSQSTKEAYEKKYRTIVATTPENLESLYKHLGFKNTGISQMVTDPWSSNPDEKLKLSLIYNFIEKYKKFLGL